MKGTGAAKAKGLLAKGTACIVGEDGGSKGGPVKGGGSKGGPVKGVAPTKGAAGHAPPSKGAAGTIKGAAPLNKGTAPGGKTVPVVARGATNLRLAACAQIAWEPAQGTLPAKGGAAGGKSSAGVNPGGKHAPVD